MNAIIVVDVQKDFCPGGALAVANGDAVIEPINRLNRYGRPRGWKRIFTKDWHSPNNQQFIENGGIWPTHCLQGTPGADFHPNLVVEDDAVIVLKGVEDDADGYSGFSGRLLLNNQSLHQFLQDNNITVIILDGLTTEFCDLMTVLDGLNLKRPDGSSFYKVYVVVDAIKAVDLQPGDGDAALEQMKQAGAILVTVEEVLKGACE